MRRRIARASTGVFYVLHGRGLVLSVIASAVANICSARHGIISARRSKWVAIFTVNKSCSLHSGFETLDGRAARS
jgi:hypothetical protein